MRRVLMIMAAAGFLAAAAPAQAALVGDPASSWQTDGKVNAIVVGNGRIYIGGSFTHVTPPGGGAAVARNHLAALNAKTGALMAWNPGANDIVNALTSSPTARRSSSAATSRR